MDVTVDGVLTTFADTARALDTGGPDGINSNPVLESRQSDRELQRVAAVASDRDRWRPMPERRVRHARARLARARDLDRTGLLGVTWFRRRKMGASLPGRKSIQRRG